MILTVNGKESRFDQALTLQELLHNHDIREKEGIAVALNDSVIAKSEYGKRQLHDGDRIEIVRAVQGG